MTLKKEFALGFTFLASVALEGCATVPPTPPKPVPVSGLDPKTCLHTTVSKHNRGLLFFLPARAKVDKTEMDMGCVARKEERQVTEGTRAMAVVMLTTKDVRLKAIATAVYDKMTPEDQNLVKAELTAKGVNIEDILKKMPRIVNSISNDNGLTVFYRLPGQDENSPPSMLYRAYPDANEQVTAEKPVPQAPPQP